MECIGLRHTDPAPSSAGAGCCSCIEAEFLCRLLLLLFFLAQATRPPRRGSSRRDQLDPGAIRSIRQCTPLDADSGHHREPGERHAAVGGAGRGGSGEGSAATAGRLGAARGDGEFTPGQASAIGRGEIAHATDDSRRRCCRCRRDAASTTTPATPSSAGRGFGGRRSIDPLPDPGTAIQAGAASNPAAQGGETGAGGGPGDSIQPSTGDTANDDDGGSRGSSTDGRSACCSFVRLTTQASSCSGASSGRSAPAVARLGHDGGTSEGDLIQSAESRLCSASLATEGTTCSTSASGSRPDDAATDADAGTSSVAITAFCTCYCRRSGIASTATASTAAAAAAAAAFLCVFDCSPSLPSSR